MDKGFLTRHISVFFETGMLFDGTIHEEIKIADAVLREKATYSLVEHLVRNWGTIQQGKAYLIERATR